MAANKPSTFGLIELLAASLVLIVLGAIIIPDALFPRKGVKKAQLVGNLKQGFGGMHSYDYGPGHSLKHLTDSQILSLTCSKLLDGLPSQHRSGRIDLQPRDPQGAKLDFSALANHFQKLKGVAPPTGSDLAFPKGLTWVNTASPFTASKAWRALATRRADEPLSPNEL